MKAHSPRRAAALFSMCVGVWLLCAGAFAQVAWTTRGFNLSRTGNNQNETILNQANVNTGQFGLLFTRPVDGQIYAQPLVMPNVVIPGKGTFNVVYVATEHDSVYAFDADNPLDGAPLWQRSFIDPAHGVTTIPYYDLTFEQDIHPEVGITGTPVIDPTSGTLYVVVRTLEGDPNNDASYVQRLWALDITTGATKFGSPVVLSASLPGTGDGSSGGIVSYNGRRENQRPGLALSGGKLYISSASHGDQTPYHGWVLAYDAKTLQQTAFYCSTPNGYDGGIWMSGQAPAVDYAGNVYAATGNGHYNAATSDFGDSVLKLNPSTLALMDYFTPWNQASLDAGDTDLGVCGPIILPNTNFLVQGSKEGKLYLINLSNMGKFDAAGDNQIAQWWQACSSLICAPPVVWNGNTSGLNMYVWSSYDVLKGFSFNGKTFNEAPFANTNASAQFPGGMLTLSSAGAKPSSLIVWATTSVNASANQTTVPGILYAFNGQTLAELWDSHMVAGDDFGDFAKFNPPVVANGKVFVPTFSNQLAVYGLLPPVPPDPVGISAQAGDGEVVLTWSTVHAVGNYTILRGPVGGPYATVATVSGANTMYDDTGLTDGKAYAYRVVTSNAFGSSIQSNEADATPAKLTPPSTPNGLQGIYFNDPSDESTQFTTVGYEHVDTTINFYWNGNSPGGKIGDSSWSAMWYGTLVAPQTGYYTFQTVSDDGARLWLGGKQLINAWVEQAPTSYYSNPVLLVAGKSYAIQVEYFQGPGGSQLNLLWSPPGSNGNFSVVPASNLFTYVNYYPQYDEPLDLTASFTTNGMSFLDNPRAGNIGWENESFAAELMPSYTSFELSPAVVFILGLGYPSALNIVECEGQTITTPVYAASHVYVVGCGVGGAQTGTFTFTYTDNTTSTQTLTFTDWGSAKAQNGELLAERFKVRHNLAGILNQPASIFRYDVPLGGKRLRSITLPDNSSMKILAVSALR